MQRNNVKFYQRLFVVYHLLLLRTSFLRLAIWLAIWADILNTAHHLDQRLKTLTKRRTTLSG